MGLATFAAFLRHPRQHPTNLAYFISFVYGLGLYSLMLLIPLYAINQGFRLSNQGIIIAAPAVFMILLRLPGGAISDRFGERVVIVFAFVSLLTSALIAIPAASMLSLIVSQLFSGASRSVYWSAAQSYISRSAEGDTGKVMGVQLAFESAAGIIAALTAGFIAEIFGFKIAFAFSALLAIVGLAVTFILPPLPRKDQVRSIAASFAPAKEMLFSRSLAFAHFVAFMAAAYMGLMSGLFIAFFRHIGYSEGLTGLVRSLNGIGVVIVAYFFGVLLSRIGPRTTGVAGMVVTGVASIGVAASSELPVLPVLLMTVSGVSFGTLRALYPVITAQKSAPNQRAMALAVVSLYWAIAMLLSPLVFGFIADGTSIRTAVYIFGGFSIVMGLAAPLVYALGETSGEHDRAVAKP